MIDYDSISVYGRIRMRSLAGFFVCQIWVFYLYLILLYDGMVIDCYTFLSSQDTYCNVDMRESNAMFLILLPILHSVSFPLFYYIFYYPQKWYYETKYAVGKEIVEVEVVKEVEVLKEVEVIKEVPVFRESQQGIIIKNYQVKDGVVTEE